MSSAQQFADALQRLESDRDLDAFLTQFTEDVALVRPEPGGSEQGREGARRFWQAYLDQFESISSSFDRLADDGALGELEWVSTGTLSSGRPISYAGVSLLERGADGLVARFATYYDTAAFTRPSAEAHEA